MNPPNISFSDSYLDLLNFSDQNISIEKNRDSEPLNRPISSVDNDRSSGRDSADIKDIKLEFLNPEKKNFLLSNLDIYFKLVYPNDWPKDYQLINEEDNQKENTISLIGRFKAISDTKEVEEECNLSSKLSDGKWEPLADMILDKSKSQFLSSDDQKIICFKLRPKKNCTKLFIVQKLLQEKIQEKITHHIVNRYSLFFYVVAFNGQCQKGQTNDIEMHTKKNQDNVKKKNRADKRPRKRKRIESPSSSNAENHPAEPPLNSILTQINEQNLSTQIPMDLMPIGKDSISIPFGFRLSSVNGSSFDSPSGFQFVVSYPEDWQEKVKRFITSSSPYDLNDQNIISLFGQFKVTCFTERKTIEVTSDLFDFNENNSRLESLASIVSMLEPARDIVSCCHLVPGQNHNKFSIVKRILNNQNSTHKLNHCTRLSFFIIAQNGRLKLGETNCIEITSQMN